jgi:hypothetical protein
MSFEDYSDGSAAFGLRREFNPEDDVEPLREEVLKGEVLSPSAVEGGVFRFGNIVMVGHNLYPTSPKCATFSKFLACTRVELHNKMMFDKSAVLVNCSGKADVHPVFNSCHKPSCPVCYERGWAVREADNINFRLEESVKRFDHVVFGEPEHIIVSLPASLYSADEKKLRLLCLDGLARRGVVGGVVIPHFARFKRGRGWYLGIHFHVLGFIKGTMRKCRGCRWAGDRGSRPFCTGCEGFYGVSKRCYADDGLIVEVKDERKSVFGTAWYQLHHATFDGSKRRAHVVTWFGVCSYRRLKIANEVRKEYDRKRKPKCRICGSVMTVHDYVGRDADVIAWFVKRRGAREKVERFFGLASDFVERPEARKWGSGSYEE